MTKNLQTLISKAYPKQSTPNILCLATLFDHLKGSRLSLPTVEELKRRGPEEFGASEQQEDAQNYLIRLIEKLEKEFKSQGLLEEFKGIFEIELKDILACRQCPYKTEKVEHEYVHTVPHTQSFALEYQEDITDYPCPECKQRSFTKTAQLTLKGSLLIVHINRFSVSRGSTRKELPTMSIRRQIGNYQLVGMLFHVGKRIEFGHYTYYSRVSPRRWAHMNDA
jgi:uncharacterized UBP type Zn finger protein